MGYKAAVQVLKQADDLKTKVSKKCDWLNSAEAWTDQQQLQNIYHQVLVLDLEYALDKKVEQDLWNIGFKNHISNLQDLARDKKNPHRSDCQALLTWALEAASGFYITLLQELCNTFDIDLPFRRRGTVYGQAVQASELVDIPQTSSCLYICQYCLVHLGDIARYRNQRKEAESFYKQAILVSPTSGQPYNQLALLEASQGNKLSTVFYYIRGISVKNPFPASVTNLSSTLSSAIDKDSPSEKIPTKMTVSEFIQLFLCTHGYFHLTCELQQAEAAVTSLNSIMTALVATQSFTKDMLIKMTIINLYTLSHIGASQKNLQELTLEEKKVRELVLELIAGSLCAFLVPVHTLKMDDSLLDYYALPAVKFLLYFIQNKSGLLKEKVFANKLQIWPSLVKLLNNVQKYLKGINFSKYNKYPLTEDKALQGFLPLSKNFKDFDFKESINDPKIEKLVRMKRLVTISLWLTDIDVNGNKFITKSDTKNGIIFESGSVLPDPTNDLLEEMKSFNFKDNSESDKKKGIEKKAGILKPQGSLEKSREERELLSNNIDVTTSSLNLVNVNNKNDANKFKRGKQNVALQSIFKKMEETNKQVKFIVDESSDKEKSVKFEQMPTQPKNQTNNQSQQYNLSLRTQSFNQNHPAFPIAPAQQDYLTNLRNVPNVQNIQMDKGNNFQFPKNEPVPQNMPPNIPLHPPHPSTATHIPIMQPYQNVSQPQNKITPNISNQAVGTNFQNSQGNFQTNPPNYPPNPGSFSSNQMSTPFQSLSFPFNNWKRDEMPPMPNPSWWQNVSQPPPTNQNFPRDNYSINYPAYSNFNNPLVDFNKPPNPSLIAKHDFNKPLVPQHDFNSSLVVQQSSNPSLLPQDFNKSKGLLPPKHDFNKASNQGGGDVFGTPWGGYTGNYMNEGTFEGNTGISMRQAMLKEAVGPQTGTVRRLPNPQPQDSNYSTPGYSLFNTNSWNPNLAGQLRNNKQNDNSVSQQSFFSGQGPKSLAQLLEQQSQLNKSNL